jgi:hypothetical protein
MLHASSITEVDRRSLLHQLTDVVKRKKKLKAKGSTSIPQMALISLKPSISDYATFVQTTSGVLGVTGPASRKTRPNKLALSLADLAS